VTAARSLWRRARGNTTKPCVQLPARTLWRWALGKLCPDSPLLKRAGVSEGRWLTSGRRDADKAAELGDEATVGVGNELPVPPYHGNHIFLSNSARHILGRRHKQRRWSWSALVGPAVCTVGSLPGRFGSGRAQRSRSPLGNRSPRSRSCLRRW